MTKVIDIHKATNIPLSTIYYNLNKLKTLNSLERKPYPKRLKKITPLVRPAITHFAKRNPYCTSKDIQAYLEEKHEIIVSTRTIQQTFKKMGYGYLLPKPAPMLTDQHKTARLCWCKAHLKTNWKKVIFSDETAIQLFTNCSKMWMKLSRKRRRPIPKNQQKIMVWVLYVILVHHPFIASLA